LPTISAKAVEDGIVPLDLKAKGIHFDVLCDGARPGIEVPEAPALPAQKVIVRQHIAIVAGKITARDLGNCPLPMEASQIAVHGAKAHPREPLTDKRIELVAPRVALELP
jgi:hypothetical protein